MEQLETQEVMEQPTQEQIYENRKVQAENMRLKKRILQLEKENRELKKFIGGE